MNDLTFIQQTKQQYNTQQAATTTEDNQEQLC